MVKLIEFLTSRGLVKEVLDEVGGVYLLQAVGRPLATAHLQERLVERYLEQLSLDSDSGPPGTTPETLLEVWALEETGVIGWSTKVFGVRYVKRKDRVEWFSESELDDGHVASKSDSAYWTAERP